ncbi:anti-sigma factor antagonist [Rubrobacter xylanophilus]|uniref:Anti-sigma factor antagonist n=1 Tax=Rubrobacter xylanophilus TaxID=49319 RepID=A0A510HGR0_9ACTN|nr:STAS domain-containing protein [Rubrobacter xylanophilus]BBL79172.1 anti-sigma factor antagonist [Rubrobacter xylanophilus]
MDAEAPSFAVLLHAFSGIPVVKVSGELELLTAHRFREALEEAAASAGQSRMVVVDMSGLEFMDSSGVSALLAATRGFMGGGGRVRLVVRDSPVQRTLRVTGLDRIFPIYPDVRSATNDDKGAA